MFYEPACMHGATAAAAAAACMHGWTGMHEPACMLLLLQKLLLLRAWVRAWLLA
jgi:hypothetical protein